MKEFIIRNNTKAILAICRDWGAILLIAWVNVQWNNMWLYLPSVWLIGAFQFALGESMLHEASHHNLFRQKRLNYRLQFCYALPFCRTVGRYRAEHLIHHNSLGRKDDQLVADYKQQGLLKPRINLFYIWFIRPLTGYVALYNFRAFTLKPFRTEGWKIVLFWAVVLLLFGLTGKLLWVVKFWIIPFVWSFSAYLYWSEISDHFHTVTGTRSSLNPFTNFITHNNGFHYVHHKYPTIPWFLLPEAYDKLAPGQGDISSGFMDTYRQIRQNRAAHFHNHLSNTIADKTANG